VVTGPEEGVSPMGRYAPAGAPESADRLVTVQLLGTPLRLLAAGREWHDSVLGELRSRALQPPGGEVPPQLAELTQVLGVRYGQAAARPDAEVDAALDAGELRRDLVYRVPAGAAEAARTLDRLMAQADQLCAAGLLLTPPRPPLVVRFAGWYVEQFSRQCSGQGPQPWDGPLELPGGQQPR
jgi:hypothetical protein